MTHTEPMRPRGPYSRYWDGRHRYKVLLDPKRTPRGRMRSITRRLQRRLVQR